MTEFENDIARSLEALRNGGTILYPTDTIWGIGCDATDEAAVAKIYALKQRDEAKSLVVLMADAKDLVKYLASPRTTSPMYWQGSTAPPPLFTKAPSTWRPTSSTTTAPSPSGWCRTRSAATW
ncbi:Sua5/YciO/YrdC/YwlC family protein [Chitinophaga pollutisoli]|uniref:L-threonylcarbamoyladenylate synthase n=1 Tax=Chitinophaga pollutisoli TaxID=3133966 RepID=A0ABZ2YSC2_9BACT